MVNEVAFWMVSMLVLGPVIAGIVFCADRWLYRRWWESQLDDDEPAEVPADTPRTL